MKDIDVEGHVHSDDLKRTCKLSFTVSFAGKRATTIGGNSDEKGELKEHKSV